MTQTALALEAIGTKVWECGTNWRGTDTESAGGSVSVLHSQQVHSFALLSAWMPQQRWGREWLCQYNTLAGDLLGRDTWSRYNQGTTTLPVEERAASSWQRLGAYFEDVRLAQLLLSLDDTAWAFLKRRVLADDFLRFARFALTVFSRVTALSARVDSDPEEGTEWIVLQLQIQGTPDAVAEDYDNFIERVMDDLPTSSSRGLRLSFDVIEGAWTEQSS